MANSMLQDAHLHLHPGSRLLLSSGRIDTVFLNSTSSADLADVLLNARKDKKVIPFLGFHPWYLEDSSGNFNILAENLNSAPEAGIGECGLDFSRNYKISFDKQVEYFEKHIILAKELKRPMSIHCVRSWGPMLELLQRYEPFPNGFILHSFYGASDISKQIIKLGGYLSLSELSLRNPQRTYDVIKTIPGEKLLIESDMTAGSPEFSAETHLQKLEYIYNTVAEIKQTSAEELIRQVRDNGKVFKN